MKVGDIVDIDWQLNVDGYCYKDGLNWYNKKVVGFTEIIYRSFVLLEGHPMCPVRIERLNAVKLNEFT
jgi:hypothetical protein